MPTKETPEIVVIGAGVVGCIAARALAKDHDVLVLERDSIAAGASGLAGASTFSSRFANDMPVVAGHINQWFRDYAESGGVDLTLSWDYEPVLPDEVDEEQRRVAEMSNQGYPVEFVSQEELENNLPRMELSSFGGAVRHDDYSWVDPLEYTEALAEDAKAAGATFETGTEVTDVAVEDGRVTGVETTTGERQTGTVVAAAGWRTGDLLSDTVSLPIRPYITQGCEVDLGFDVDPQEFPAVRLPVGGDEGSIYADNQETLLIRPKSNANFRVAGGHNAYPRDEFNYVEASSGISAEKEFVEFVQQTLPTYIPDVDEVTVLDTWAGTGGGLTPDTRPIIDEVPEADGLVIATGFRAGFILSPIAAQGVRSLVTEERCPFNLKLFAQDRF